MQGSRRGLRAGRAAVLCLLCAELCDEVKRGGKPIYLIFSVGISSKKKAASDIGRTYMLLDAAAAVTW